jgi:hypothetical protein
VKVAFRGCLNRMIEQQPAARSSIALFLDRRVIVNVRYWPKADIPSCTAHVRFSGVKRT